MNEGRTTNKDAALHAGYSPASEQLKKHHELMNSHASHSKPILHRAYEREVNKVVRGEQSQLCKTSDTTVR